MVLHTSILVTGILLLCMSLSNLHDRITLLKGGFVTEATVIDYKYKTISTGESISFPVIKYTNYDKEEITQLYRKPYSGAWRVSDKVKIVYVKNYVSATTALDFWALFDEIVLYLCAAIICLFISIGYFLSQLYFKPLISPK